MASLMVDPPGYPPLFLDALSAATQALLRTAPPSDCRVICEAQALIELGRFTLHADKTGTVMRDHKTFQVTATHCSCKCYQEHPWAVCKHRYVYRLYRAAQKASGLEDHWLRQYTTAYRDARAAAGDLVALAALPPYEAQVAS